MDNRVSKLFTQFGFVAALCDALIIIIITVFQYSTVGWLHLFDAVLLIILALFIKKHSKVAAVLLVIYQLGLQVIFIGTTKDYLQILWLVFFILGAIGVFGMRKESN